MGRDNKLHFQGVSVKELRDNIDHDPQFKQEMDECPDLGKVGIQLLDQQGVNKHEQFNSLNSIRSQGTSHLTPYKRRREQDNSNQGIAMENQRQANFKRLRFIPKSDVPNTNAETEALINHADILATSRYFPTAPDNRFSRLGLETEATSQKPSYAEVTKPQEIELPEQVGHLNKLAVMRQIEKMNMAKSYLGANCANQGGMDRLDQLKASHTFALSQIKLDRTPAHLLTSTSSTWNMSRPRNSLLRLRQRML